MGRLFVGNLSWNVGEQELREHAEANGIGVTKVTVVTDRDTGRSRGFGFVDVSGDVMDAVDVLDGTCLDGRDIRVNEAHERERRPRNSSRVDQGAPITENRRGNSKRRRGDGDRYDQPGW